MGCFLVRSVPPTHGPWDCRMGKSRAFAPQPVGSRPKVARG